MKQHVLIILFFSTFIFTKAAPFMETIKAISNELQAVETRDNLIETKPTTAVAVENNTKNRLVSIGSIIATFLALLLPIQACYSSGNCQQYITDFFSQTERRKRDLEYLETVLAALLDTFVENDNNNGHNQELSRPAYNEPLLITLAKYFDKYADKTVKKHVKSIVFFLVHILGRIYGVVQHFVRLLAEYRIL